MSDEDNLRRIIESIRDENDGNSLDFVVPGYAATKILAYQGIRQDLLFCKGYVNTLVNSTDPIVSSALLYSFLALYGRCFTDSPSCKLEVSDLTNENSTFVELHHEIMDMRHNFIAHRGNTKHETGFAYVKLNIHDHSRGVKVKQLKRVLPDRNKLTQYSELIDFLITIAEGKFQKAGEKVWKHLLKEYDSEMLSMLKIAGPTIEDKTN